MDALYHTTHEGSSGNISYKIIVRSRFVIWIKISAVFRSDYLIKINFAGLIFYNEYRYYLFLVEIFADEVIAAEVVEIFV